MLFCGFHLLFACFGQSRRHCCDLGIGDVVGAVGVIILDNRQRCVPRLASLELL